MLTNFIVFFTSFFATVLSSMSGGGSSVISLPIFLSLGIPFPLATAIQKVSAVFWVLPAARNYLKGRRIDWTFLCLFSGIGMIGVYASIQFIVSVPQRMLEIIVGVLILCIVTYTVLQKNVGLQEARISSPVRRALAYPLALVLGFYEGIFGSGNGILLSIITMKTRGFDFIDALGHYFAIAFPWVLFGTALLIKKGMFDLSLMIPATLGSVAGSYVGSAYAKYKGNSFIKVVFGIVGAILGLKLILHF